MQTLVFCGASEAFRRIEYSGFREVPARSPDLLLRSLRSLSREGTTRRIMVGAVATAAIAFFGANAQAGRQPAVAHSAHNAALLTNVKVTTRDPVSP